MSGNGRLPALAREVGKITVGPARYVVEGVDYADLYVDPRLPRRFLELLWFDKLGTGPGGRHAPENGTEPSIVARPFSARGQAGLVVALVRERDEREKGSRQYLLCRYLVLESASRCGPADFVRHLEQLPLEAWSRAEAADLSPERYAIEETELDYAATDVGVGWIVDALGWIYAGVPLCLLTPDPARFGGLAQAIWSRMPLGERALVSWAWRCAEDVERTTLLFGGTQARAWAATWDDAARRWIAPSLDLNIDGKVSGAFRGERLEAGTRLAEAVVHELGPAGFGLERNDPRALPSDSQGFVSDGRARLVQLASEFADVAVLAKLREWLDEGATGPVPAFPRVSLDLRVRALALLLERALLSERQHRRGVPGVEALLWEVFQSPFGQYALHEHARRDSDRKSLRVTYVIALLTGDGVPAVLTALVERGIDPSLPLVGPDGRGAVEAFELALDDLVGNAYDWRGVHALAALLLDGRLRELDSVIGPRLPGLLARLVDDGGYAPWLSGPRWTENLLGRWVSGPHARLVGLLLALERTGASVEVPRSLEDIERRILQRRLEVLWQDATMTDRERLLRAAQQLAPWTDAVDGPVLQLALGQKVLNSAQLFEEYRRGRVPAALERRLARVALSEYASERVGCWASRTRLQPTRGTSSSEEFVATWVRTLGQHWPAFWARLLADQQGHADGNGSQETKDPNLGVPEVVGLLGYWARRRWEGLSPEHLRWLWRKLVGFGPDTYRADPHHWAAQILIEFAAARPRLDHWSDEAFEAARVFLREARLEEADLAPLRAVFVDVNTPDRTADRLARTLPDVNWPKAERRRNLQEYMKKLQDSYSRDMHGGRRQVDRRLIAAVVVLVAVSLAAWGTGALPSWTDLSEWRR